MRDILTGLAIVVIVILTTLLVAPYFVDWNGQRGFLETQLSRALGQTVTIGGAIDLKLLPTPYIRLNQAVVGSDDGAVRIGIHHLDLELAVAPLLHGEFDVVEGRLDEPTIRVTLQPDRSLPSLPPTPALKADIRLERIVVTDGTLALADPSSGRTFVLDHLDFTAEAPSLDGPFKIAGSAGSDASRTKFRVSTSEARQGRTHLHVAIGESGAYPGIDLDGEVTLSATSDAVRQSFQGSVTALGHLAASDTSADTPVPWQLSGPLEADPASARIAGGTLRIGGDSGLAFKADLESTFGETASLAATLSATQLDVDRLAGAPTDLSKIPAPPQLPSVQRLRALAKAAMPPVPTRLDVAVDSAIWGGQALDDLELHLEPVADGNRLRASGDGPGALHVALDGTLRTQQPSFDGQVRIGATDVPRALTWAERVAPDITPPRTALPFTAIDVSGPATVDTYGLVSKAATLDLDRSHLTGSLRLAFGEGGKPARLAADLATDKLDLDALPKAGLGRDASSPAFDLKLAAGAAHIASFGSGALESGAVTLDASGSGDRLDLHKLGVENLGGATLTASGSLAGEAAALTARIDADRLDAAAALIGQIAPGGWSDRLAARAIRLAPAHLAIETKLAARDHQGSLTPSQVKLDGTLGGTSLHVALEPHDPSSTLSVRAEAPDGLSLLHQLGVPTTSTAAPTGPGRLALSASGDIEGPMTTRLDAGLGATTLSVTGRFALLGKTHGGSGTADLKSADLGPVLRGLGLQSPDSNTLVPADLAGGIAAGDLGLALSDLKGHLGGANLAGTLKAASPAGDAPVLTGTLDVDRLALATLAEAVLGPARAPVKGAAWSGESFAAPASTLPRAELALRARTLDLTQGVAATDAALDLRVAPGLVALSHGEAKLRGGRLSGAFTLHRDGSQATMEGSLGVESVALNLPALGAGLTGKLDLAGGGASPLALVGGLAGSGTATLSDTRVPGADPQALPNVFALVEEDALTVDEEAVDRALDEAARGALAAGTRQMSLGLAGGTLTLTPAEPASSAPAAAGRPITSEIGATFDLRTRSLSVRAEETMHDLPKDWSGSPPSIVVVQAGPLDAPRRSFEVAGFLNAVAARAIARESARIEAYEFDIRERALFNTRLQADRRREQDRLKAEADAKAAAEAAKRAAAEAARKAEAARVEKLRADEAARVRSESTPPADRPPSDRPQDAPRFDAPPSGAAADPSAAGRY